MKKLQLFGIFLGLLLIPSHLFASDPLGYAGCPISAGRNLSVGSTDLPNDGRVSALQQYLISKGFLVMPAGVSTGYFGNLTRAALASFQASVGITPAVGYFGPITRNYINSHCGNPVPPTSSLHVDYISPTSGPGGNTQVTIYGSGFTSSSNMISFNGENLPGPYSVNGSNQECDARCYYFSSPNGTTLTFWVPLNPPDQYSVKVSNSNGTSNSVNFTVTDGSSGDTIIKREGEQEANFLIQRINQDSVDGLYWPYSPVGQYPPPPGQPKTLYIGDEIGYQCDGTAERVTGINYYVRSIRSVEFTKINSPPSQYGCPICLSGNTLIDTPAGPINVKDLKIGMPIWTTDKGGNRVAGTVIKTSKVIVPPTHQMIHLVLSDGRNVFVSPGHPTIDNRTIGDLVKGDNYDNATVLNTDRVPYDQEATYDTLPSGETGFYWANRVLLGSTLFSK